MLNMQQTQDALFDLQYGDNPPNLLNALRFAALSPLQNLEKNGRMARVLAAFTDKPLPEGDALYAVLKPCKGLFFKLHRAALEALDVAWQNGQLAPFYAVPADYDGQVAWRDALVETVKGMGLKTASFALLLYAPTTCQLIPIDCHHLRRLGMEGKSTPKRATYLAIEAMIASEKRAAGYNNVPLGTFAALLWGIQRDGEDAASYPSHRDLSPCNY